MADQLIVKGGTAVLHTAEGKQFSLKEKEIVETIKLKLLPPIDGVAFPDGVKFFEWHSPYLIVVHQTPPHVRRLRWIAEDSPSPFGRGTKYRDVRISLPYVITVATFAQHRDHLALTSANELYFRNQPLRFKSDRIGYPALLNISQMKSRTRESTWICVQNLHNDPTRPWPEQLDALLDHTLNGAFNLSSEHHEGASYYAVSNGVHPDLHPIERWEKASLTDERFVLHVPWLEAKFSVAELIDHITNEQTSGKAVGIRRKKKPMVEGGLVSEVLNFVQKRKST